MEYTNEMRITMISNEAVNNAKAVIENVLNSKDYNSGYSFNATEQLLEALEVKNNTLSLDGNDGYFVPQDAQEIFEEIVKALAFCGLIEFKAYNYSTYSESSLEAEFHNDHMEVESIYYPCGYCEYLECPECGEFVVRIDEYDPNATYYCPECGEEIDLSKQYEEVVQEIKKYRL